MLKHLSKYLFFIGLIVVFGQSQTLSAGWPFHWFQATKVADYLQAEPVADDAQPLLRLKPKAMSSTTPIIAAPAKPEQKKLPWVGRHIIGTARIEKAFDFIDHTQKIVDKQNADGAKTLHDMRETALLVRYTFIPVAILSCVLMVKSIFPHWFPGSSPKAITS